MISMFLKMNFSPPKIPPSSTCNVHLLIQFLQHLCILIFSFLHFRTRVNKFEVYFKSNKFVVNKRSERFGFIDFISNCGGLMGLFMGISLLSIAESFHYFIYFLWQLVCNLYYRNNRVYDIEN
jgi:hypothetical protein